MDLKQYYEKLEKQRKVLEMYGRRYDPGYYGKGASQHGRRNRIEAEQARDEEERVKYGMSDFIKSTRGLPYEERRAKGYEQYKYYSPEITRYFYQLLDADISKERYEKQNGTN